MNQNSSPPSQWQAAEALEKNRATHNPLAISVWVAPIIVGVGALILGLVVAALLLGGK